MLKLNNLLGRMTPKELAEKMRVDADCLGDSFNHKSLALQLRQLAIVVEKKNSLDRDTCPFCDSKRPIVSGPSSPLPYVCLEHREFANYVWPRMVA